MNIKVAASIHKHIVLYQYLFAMTSSRWDKPNANKEMEYAAFDLTNAIMTWNLNNPAIIKLQFKYIIETKPML
jgi:hypothetical protein